MSLVKQLAAVFGAATVALALFGGAYAAAEKSSGPTKAGEAKPGVKQAAKPASPKAVAKAKAKATAKRRAAKQAAWELDDRVGESLVLRSTSALVLDQRSGDVLFEKNADQRMHPSSMSKLMTVYMVFQQLKEGRLKMDDTFPVSEKAWRMQGSKMFVALNSRVSVEELLRGVIIQSGNLSSFN